MAKYVSGPGPLGIDIDFTELEEALQKRFPENSGTNFAAVAQGNTTSVDTVSFTPAIGDTIVIEVAYEKVASGDGDVNVIVDGKSHTIQRGDVKITIQPDMLDVTKVAFFEDGMTAAGAEVSNVTKTTNGTDWWTDGFDVVISFAVSAGVGSIEGTWTMTHWKAR